ncbi:hypothetical protein FJT64_005204 [Amphibalanus amphitrite]|uniref:Uncharacterized protein n=1 Tax=Amphibalanus amphitrite TaxID=1232801 RepID=A0A6A4VRK4_AMPAM|nr:hypothetical protein FJT64_005204 [Amphibalanus amphitrite]
MVLLRTALLAALLLTALAPAGGHGRSRRAGRRRGSNSPSDRAPPPGAGQGRVPESAPELEPELDPELDPELEQLLGAAPFPSATNSSALSRSPRMKRTLVIPNGLTVGVIPRFDYTVFTDPNGEQLVVSVEVEIDYTFPKTASSGKSALNRMSRMLYDKQTIYSSMETLFTRFGLDGRACTLRAICEVGETPDHQDGIVGDFLSYLLSASYGVGDRPELKSYLQAERYGRKYGHCGTTFRSCPVSIFSLVADESSEDDRQREKGRDERDRQKDRDERDRQKGRDEHEKTDKRRRPRTGRAEGSAKDGQEATED